MTIATRSRFDVVADIAGADHLLSDSDRWGTAMGLFFDIADVLNMSDVEGDVTPGPFGYWQFRSSHAVTVPDLESVAARTDDFSEGEFSDDYTYGVVMIASALVAGEITQDDLIYAGNVLHHYTELLRLAGHDY